MMYDHEGEVIPASGYLFDVARRVVNGLKGLKGVSVCRWQAVVRCEGSQSSIVRFIVQIIQKAYDAQAAAAPSHLASAVCAPASLNDDSGTPGSHC